MNVLGLPQNGTLFRIDNGAYIAMMRGTFVSVWNVLNEQLLREE